MSEVRSVSTLGSSYKNAPLGILARLRSGDGISSSFFSKDNSLSVPVYGANGPIGSTSLEPNIRSESILIGRVGACGEINMTPANAFASDNALVVDIDDRVHMRWMYYVLLSAKLSELSTSTAQPLITASKVRQVRIPYPPLETQQRIADYLDRETAEIDAAVVDLDKYVELLEKRRQVVITQSVTRGIGSNRTRVHLRALPGGEGVSRGIQNRTEASLTGGTSESLAPLPQGWSYVPLGALCSMVAGGTPQSGTDSYWGGNDDPQNTPWISISDMSQVDLVTSTEKYVTPLGLKSAGLNPGEIGTVLFAMYASVGEVAVSGISAVWNQALLGLIPLNTEILHSPFLYYALKTLKPHLPVYFRSNTQHNLNAGTVSRLRIPLPPLESQQRIADYLDRETSEIDSLIAESTRLRDLLLKRRSVLITEVVTGRKQV